MDRNRKICARFRETCYANDTEKIISSLTRLKKSIKWTKSVHDVDEETFEVLINLIKMPNAQILDTSLSIIANCCLNSRYRELFKENGGIPHLILILKTINNDSINCRAVRLIGNLANDIKIAKELQEHDVGIILVESLKIHNDLSTSTLLMIFRSIKKLWEVQECRLKMLPEDAAFIICNRLSSPSDEVVISALETIILFVSSKVHSCGNSNSQRVVYSTRQTYDNFKVPKELLLKLVELSKEDNIQKSAVLCMSNVIVYRKRQIWDFLEGSGIAEAFISYFKKTDNIDCVIYQAFRLLCLEGNVRMKVKNAGLLPRLLQLSSHSNASKILPILYYFMYDTDSITILSRERQFIPLLIDNILLPEAVSLLSVVSKLHPPKIELAEECNLSAIINNKNCLGIMENIASNQRYLEALIGSGKVWEICKAGCSMEEIGSTGYAVTLITQLLQSLDPKIKENASLAVPFLVRPREFALLYKFFARYEAIRTIIDLLKKYPLEERILASVIRLISIFRKNHSNSYDETSSFFTMENKTDIDDFKPDVTSNQDVNVNNSNDEIITFELDSGASANISKNLLCRNSPVLDAMLNGHFAEAGQQKVKLSCCSRDALMLLAKILNNEVGVEDIPTETRLELISLTDRFLIFPLNDVLTSNLTLSKATCLSVYLWCRSAGDTKNNARIRRKAYEFLFSSSDYLILAMRNDVCRGPLIKEISNYLSNSLKDLL